MIIKNLQLTNFRNYTQAEFNYCEGINIVSGGNVPADTEMLRIRLNSPLMGIVIEPAGGTSFVDAAPEPEVFGDRALDVKGKDHEGEKEYMYFVMPLRMNK